MEYENFDVFCCSRSHFLFEIKIPGRTTIVQRGKTNDKTVNMNIK